MDMMREFRVPNELRTCFDEDASCSAPAQRTRPKQEVGSQTRYSRRSGSAPAGRAVNSLPPPEHGKAAGWRKAALRPLLQASCSIQQMDGVKAVSEFGVKTTASKRFRQSTTGWSTFQLSQTRMVQTGTRPRLVAHEPSTKLKTGWYMWKFAIPVMLCRSTSESTQPICLIQD